MTAAEFVIDLLHGASMDMCARQQSLSE